MADDIVTRLRELMADLLYNPDCDDEGCGDCAWHRIGADAIDEIERLREQVQYRDDVISMLRADVARLGSFLHPIGEEARRG